MSFSGTWGPRILNVIIREDSTSISQVLWEDSSQPVARLTSCSKATSCHRDVFPFFGESHLANIDGHLNYQVDLG